MLQSKFRRPWQPRVSDSQPYNPSAHTTESEVSFSAAIEEVEGEVPTAASAASQGAGVSAGSHSAEGGEPLSPVAPETPRSESRWYAHLVEKFAKH